jgi:hypothetical protein
MQQIYNVFVEGLKNSLEIVSQESCFFACSLEVACIFPLQVLSNIQERAITFVYYTDLPISLWVHVHLIKVITARITLDCQGSV